MCKFTCRGDTKECPCECTNEGCRISAIFGQVVTGLGLVLGWLAVLAYYVLGFIATIEIVNFNSPSDKPDTNCENLPCFCYSMLNIDAPVYLMLGIFSSVAILYIVKVSELCCQCKVSRGCCRCCPYDGMLENGDPVSNSASSNDNDNGPVKPEQGQAANDDDEEPVAPEASRQQDENRLCICNCSTEFCISPWWIRVVSVFLAILTETMVFTYFIADAAAMIIIENKSMIGGVFGTPKYSSFTMNMIAALITTDFLFAFGSVIFAAAIFAMYMRPQFGCKPRVLYQYVRVQGHTGVPGAHPYTFVDTSPSAPSITTENV